jgi:predicted Fe-S protein YdhL (DUF1289 family)
MSAVDTPCIKICTLDRTSGLCLGCGRTADEIARWLAFSADERRAVMREAAARLACRDATRPAASVA